MSIPHIYNNGVASIHYSATGKLRYDVDSLRLMDRIKMNPIDTAWELIPYSFVVDWFVDISGFITAQCYSLSCLANERKMCIAEKVNYNLTNYLYIPPASGVTDIPVSYYGYEGSGLYENSRVKAEDPQQVTYTTGGTSPLSTESMDGYVRGVFQPGDIKLQFYNDLNWRRILDALALSSQKVSNSFRNIR